VARDNRISNYLNGPYNANGATAQFANNNAGTQLTWSPSRGKPGPNHRWGDPLGEPLPWPDPDPDAPPPPPPPPDPNTPNAPISLSGTTIGISQLSLIWNDTSTDEDGFQVERLAEDGVTWLVVGTLGENTTTFSMSDLTSGRPYTFRVRAFNEYGFSAASNEALVRMPLPSDVSSQNPLISPAIRPRPATNYRGGSKSIIPDIVSDT
jgi:hypothetical protein